MSVQNPERLATKQDLKDMYDRIRPYMGGLPEVVANKFSKGDLYSTDEKMIGQWVDGKPLYQKVFSYDTSLTVTDTEQSTYIANLDSLGIDRVINTQTFFKWNGISHNTPFITKVAAGEIYVYSFFNRYNNSDVVEFKYKRPSGTTEITDIKAIVMYTKSSDTAISIGESTDYSTEEKIIGTWIDGKPLWQKTVYFDNLPTTAGRTDFNHNIANVDCVVSHDSRIIYPSSGLCMNCNSIYIDDPSSYANSQVVMVTCTNEKVVVKNTKTLANAILYTTLQYTKSNS